MNLKYVLGSLISFPFLPIMYFQGKQIRKKVPRLPEAKNNAGQCKHADPLAKTLQVIALGESTMAGIGVNIHEEGFTGTFATALSSLTNSHVKWKVYAKSGYTASKVTEKLLPTINEPYADLIIIGLGGNDAFTLNTPERWKNDVRKLLDQCIAKFPDSKIAFCNMPPIKQFPAFTPLIKFTIGNLVEILGEELKTVVADYPNVYFFDEIITLEKWGNRLDGEYGEKDFFSDGVHPSKLTYQTWAKEFAKKIVEVRLLKN